MKTCNFKKVPVSGVLTDCGNVWGVWKAAKYSGAKSKTCTQDIFIHEIKIPNVHEQTCTECWVCVANRWIYTLKTFAFSVWPNTSLTWKSKRWSLYTFYMWTIFKSADHNSNIQSGRINIKKKVPEMTSQQGYLAGTSVQNQHNDHSNKVKTSKDFQRILAIPSCAMITHCL